MNRTLIHGSHQSRRTFFGRVTTAGTILGAGLFGSRSAHAAENIAVQGGPKPIPGGGAPLTPFGVLVHHFGLNPALTLANLNDPSAITDFDGFVGLTNIRGGGTGTNTSTGATTTLAFSAAMGFSQGRFIGTDGRQHEDTFAFV